MAYEPNDPILTLWDFVEAWETYDGQDVDAFIAEWENKLPLLPESVVRTLASRRRPMVTNWATTTGTWTCWSAWSVCCSD